MARAYRKDIFNYMGNKFRLISDITETLERGGTEDTTFVDVFGGGGTVISNQTKFKKMIYNDKLEPLCKILFNFKNEDPHKIIKDIKALIKERDISKTNKDTFLQLRSDWNQLPYDDKYSYEGCVMLYTIICHSFNYQLGFNNSGEFNVSFGKNRSSFNPSLEGRFADFISCFKRVNVISNFSFEKIIDTSLNTGIANPVLFYLDPPYLASDDSYSRTKAVKWTTELELKLYEYCDKIDYNEMKFCLSNVIENNGIKNEILSKWLEQRDYKVNILNCDYSNCNYQKDRKSKNVEVLITNY